MITTLTRRRGSSPRSESRADPGKHLPACVFVVALALNLYGIGWGLPNGNETWANDAIQPGAPLSILHRLFVADPWNSGWFWFKYPLGHVLVLGAVYAPYLLWLLATGGLSDPTSAYPHGFADPQAALATLAVLGRGVSALMGAGCAVLAYLALVRSFGWRTALAGGLATAFCYPVVFYSHTTNVEVPYLFWLMLAFLSAVRLVEGDSRLRWWAWLGAGAAMSVSTKELGAGFFLAIPPLVVVAQRLRGEGVARIVRGVVLAGAVAAAVVIVANNVVLNPLGFARRIGFLTHTLDPDVALEYAPYYFPIDLGGDKGSAGELQQLAKATGRVVESLGWPTALLAAIGMVLGAWRRPAWTLLAVGCATSFYLLGARAMLSLSMRYVLPLSVLGAMACGIAIGALLEAKRFRLATHAVAAAVLAWIVVYGVDVSRMLAHDARYAAEQWLDRHADEGDTVEVYQRPTYLPRFPADVKVSEVPFAERSVEEFRERSPDLVVLSSAGLSGVTVEYRRDWKGAEYESEEWLPSQIAPGGAIMNYKHRDNVELLDALLGGRLGYRQIASFEVDPWIDRTLIQSLNPEIMIFARGAGGHADAEAEAETRNGHAAAGGRFDPTRAKPNVASPSAGQ